VNLPCRASAPRILVAWGIAAATAIAVMPARAQEVLGEAGIKGAGSTFAYPLLSRWSREYRVWLSRGGQFPAANAGLDDPPASSALDYEPVGSLAGTLRVKDRAVDFGASERPLTSEELASMGLCQFPIVMGGVVVVVNIDGLGGSELRLTGPVLADIFLGRINRWSDPQIKAHNPSLNLPDAAISVVRRSDGSGTTFTFTDYLSKVSPEWKLKAGAGLLISWPTGTAAKGNEGVAKAVQATRNAIGYVDHGQARRLGLRHALLQNRAGRFVKPDAATFQAAASGVDWGRAGDFHVLLTNSISRSAYPITATVFALMRRTAPRARTGAALDFFRWSMDQGAATATELGYVPLPAPLVKEVTRYWAATFEGGS
jgi:phosphate transport system substrate-binding protein